MGKKNKIEVGRMLLVSHGAYSSYERLSWFVVVQAFCPEDQLAQFMDTLPASRPSHEYGRFDHTAFLAWINLKGLMVEVEEFFDEWHMGDYGKADEVSFMPRQEKA